MSREEQVEKLTAYMANFIGYTAKVLPDDVIAKLDELAEREDGFLPKVIYQTMKKNQKLAKELDRPSCQDTGVLQFWVKCGTAFPLIGDLEALLKEAVIRATFQTPLRHNSVETFDEYNTGKNVGKGTPTVFWDIVPDSDKCEIYTYMAGGGCSLPGKAMLLATVLALVMIFPYIILGGTLRVAGGQYSVVTNLTSPSAGGLVIYSNLIFTVQFSTFAMAFGLYMNMVLPTVSAKIFGITIIFLLVGLNLLGINAFAKINNLMSGILLVSMVAYDIYGLTQINQPIFDFSSSQMFTGGFKGFFLATFLLINCCHGYYGLIYFGKEAKSATKDMPFACLMCFPVVVFIYVTLAMVTSGTVPYENANGAATILPAALAILPKPVYYAFVVGGPIMAILTTLNSSIASFRFQPTQAAKDGWLPKAILKENRFGMPPIQLLFMLIMLLIPIVFNVSIVTINYISQIIMFGLGIATLIGIARIPKLYPEAWKKNSFHMSKTALWISVLLSATLYTINFVKAVIVLEPIYAVIAVVAMVVALVLGKVIADRGGLHIETSVWPPKSE